MNLGSKNISITDEAYDALYKEKRKNESFTETILRLTQSKGKLADCLGTWVMSDEEEKKSSRGTFRSTGESLLED